MIKATNIVPSIAGLGVFAIGVNLIQKHNAIKKKENSQNLLGRNDKKTSSNPRFVEFDSQRSYIELAEFDDKSYYMNSDELEENRHYIELGVINVKRKAP